MFNKTIERSNFILELNKLNYVYFIISQFGKIPWPYILIIIIKYAPKICF